MNPKPTVYLIDGTAYIHRAFHAIQGLTNSRGMPTNAAFGFTRMLIKLMEDRQPEYAAMFFDARGRTFRHDLSPDYKATRKVMPDEMAVQIPYIKQITAAYRLPLFEMAGYEADDLIGAFSRRLAQAGYPVVMVTGDKDFVQLIGERVSIWDPMKETSLDLQGVRDTFGVEPDRMVEVMGLAGDTSDNIPGVPGIGQKTALELIRTFGTLEGLYARLDEITRKKQKDNLLQFRDQAFLSRELARIRVDVPDEVEVQALRRVEPDVPALSNLFRELEFRQLLQSLPRANDCRKDYRTIAEPGELADLAGRLKAAEAFALHVAASSADPMRAELVGLAFAVEDHRADYIPFGHRYIGAPAQLSREAVLRELKPILENPAVHKVVQDSKFAMMVLAQNGIALAGVAFDTMLASYLLDPSRRAHNLDEIALDILDHRCIAFDDIVGRRRAATFAEAPVDQAAPYACEEADLTRLCHAALAPRIDELGLAELMTSIELPLAPVLMRMQMRGMGVDTARLHELSKALEQRLEELEAGICGLAGERFNINSNQQLCYVLFEKLKLPAQKKTKKKTGYSTDVDVLMALAKHHELPAMILKHRTLAKLKSTYADALIDLVHPRTGRIHTSYHQTVTATGRLSSSDPNLQNIPIRSEEGLEIRRAFVARPGWRLLSADYSQIELRILAHCSEDELLVTAFRQGEDVHTRTASEVFELEPDRITPELRRQAKVINFGIIYGMSAFGLARQLEISQKMAKTYIDHYFQRYPGVRGYVERTIDEARRTRMTSTLLGRIRLLPDINNPNPIIRQAAERTAVNTPIQGSAADLIKAAMIRIDAALARGGCRAAMLLTVHDELVFEVPPEEMDEVTRLVKGIMEGIWELKVPLQVNACTGSNWAEAH
jgi:DNA polymerase-1